MTATAFAKRELEVLWGLLARLDPLHMRPLTPEEAIAAATLRDKTKLLIDSGAGATQRGRKVFEWRIPDADAPTQNRIRGLAFGSPFTLTSIEKRLRRELNELLDKTEGGRVQGLKTRRWVRLTRFTSQPGSIDDPNAADAIGGKMPIDALVQCGALVNDTQEFCRRDASVRRTGFKKNVHLLVEVFEMAEDEVFCIEPQDAEVEQRKKRRSAIVQSIVGEENAIVKPKRRAFGRHRFAKKAASAGGAA